jgi:hypothetical protein
MIRKLPLYLSPEIFTVWKYTLWILEIARIFRFRLHRSLIISSVLLSSTGVLILASPRHPYETYKQTRYSLSDIAPPSLSVHYILWSEIPYYTVFQFAILGMPLQISVNKQWRGLAELLLTFCVPINNNKIAPLLKYPTKKMVA